MSATYIVCSVPNLLPAECGYRLSNGSFAAISFSAGEGAAPDMFSIKATARAVNTDGTAVLDHLGRPVICHKHASAPKSSLVSGAASGAAVRDDALKEVIDGPDGLMAELAAIDEFRKLMSTPSPSGGTTI